ncbi:GspE/PulE family protein [Chitinilyticum piscinae]|uniref:Flp pilus assembly complex ATPase component TadA n=1 Tax=Chitinilyticum piscinae TaxID=2866724 RepID=A0A8J7FV52_9NEIS|nr:GspE/PulE family protein [Chitinilyticum piscinae]MBE9607850.1 Flp pilus assembly complex ATPase component TadA [Chitinilyticum piscinae]
MTGPAKALQLIENEDDLRTYIENARNQLHKPVGQLLLEAGMVTQKDLDLAFILQKSHPGMRLGAALVELGLVEELTLQTVLHQQLGVPHINLERFIIQSALLRRLPASIAREHCLLPVMELPSVIVLAGAKIPSQDAYQDLRFLLQKPVMVVIADRMTLLNRIGQHYDRIEEHLEEEARESGVKIADSAEDRRLWLEAEYLAKQTPIVKLVDSFFQEALRMRASDLHIRPRREDVELALRVDGELRTLRIIERHLLPAVVSRIKILATLNIAERRLPQDGRIALKIDGKDLDLRVSIMPTPYGENVVIRLLNPYSAVRAFDQIGYAPEDLRKLDELIRHESGMVLVTGPTGSGKTTTLYAMLQAISRAGLNIVTIEDPVEYHLPNMCQIQLLTSQGFGFPQTLRHVLRQDPDVIMVGEIRDAETAQMAVEAALTGHLVFSTLHTTSACGAIPRLLELGISPQLLKTSLLGVLAQRLVRQNCPNCRVREKIPDIITQRLGLTDLAPFEKGQGCKVCDGYGYLGRRAVYELLEPDDELREHFLPTLSERQLHAKAQAAGMRFMLGHGLELAQQGLVSLTEVYRACA